MRRPRAALGQDYEFAYPMYPSGYYAIRDYQLIRHLVHNISILYYKLTLKFILCVYRTDGDGLIASMGPRTDPTGEG